MASKFASRSLADKHAEKSRLASARARQSRVDASVEGAARLAASVEQSSIFRAERECIELCRAVLKKEGKLILLITGGRTFGEVIDVAGNPVTGKTLQDARAERQAIAAALDLHKPTTVVCGGAWGADRWAKLSAEKRGIDVVEEKADWSLGHRAGPERNQRMIDLCKPDAAVSFAGGRGTADCVSRLTKAGVPHYPCAVR